MIGSATSRPTSTGWRVRASAMLGMDDQRHLGLGQPVVDQPGRHPVGVGLDGDAGVEPLLVQVVEDGLGRRGEDVEPHARQDCFAEQPRNEDLRHAGAHADGQRVGRRPFQAARGVGEAEHVADHALGLVEERAPLLGQFDAARRAPEQREPDLLFQEMHLLAHRRLRDVEPPGGAGEAALLGDRECVTDLAEFQDRAPMRRLASGRQSIVLACDDSG